MSKQNEILNQSIDVLDLTVRSSNGLKSLNIKTIEDLVKNSGSDLLKAPCTLGRKSLTEINAALSGIGLSLKDLVLTSDSVDKLGLTTRTRNALQSESVFTVEDLLKYTEENLLKINQFGRKCLLEIIEALTSHGFKLAESDGKDYQNISGNVKPVSGLVLKESPMKLFKERFNSFLLAEAEDIKGLTLEEKVQKLTIIQNSIQSLK